MVSMNRLTASDRARILHLLCEGTSIRAVTRLTGASKNTVAKLLVDAGKACAAYHDEHVRHGLRAWPGSNAAERKIRLFDDRLIGLAIKRLHERGPDLAA